MKRIGFSKKYFTLWKVAEELEWEESKGVNLPYLKKDLQFIKNLSFDEKTAKRKSIFEGVENYEVDFGLCSPKYLEKKEIDLDQIFFEFCKHRKESDKKILLENGFEDIDGQVVFPEHAKKIQLRYLVVKEIEDKDEIEVIVLSNLNCENELRFEFKNEVFFGCWNENSKGYIYQGIEYFLPIISGKPKRVKNKPVKVKIGDFKDGVYQIKQMYVL